MSTKKLMDAIGEIDDKYIDEYSSYKAKPLIVRIVPYGALAACALLALIIGLNMQQDNPIKPNNTSPVISYITDKPEDTRVKEDVASKTNTATPDTDVADNSHNGNDGNNNTSSDKSTGNNSNRKSEKKYKRSDVVGNNIINEIQGHRTPEPPSGYNEDENFYIADGNNGIKGDNIIGGAPVLRPVRTHIPVRTPSTGSSTPIDTDVPDGGEQQFPGQVTTDSPNGDSTQPPYGPTETPEYTITWENVLASGDLSDYYVIDVEDGIPDGSDPMLPPPAATPSTTSTPKPPGSLPLATYKPISTGKPESSQTFKPGVEMPTPTSFEPDYCATPTAPSAGVTLPPAGDDKVQLNTWWVTDYPSGGTIYTYVEEKPSSNLQEANTGLNNIFRPGMPVSYYREVPMYCSVGTDNTYYIRIYYDDYLYTMCGTDVTMYEMMLELDFVGCNAGIIK